jgi:hypothetical protein
MPEHPVFPDAMMPAAYRPAHAIGDMLQIPPSSMRYWWDLPLTSFREMQTINDANMEDTTPLGLLAQALFTMCLAWRICATTSDR